jgi:hypothetical protein
MARRAKTWMFPYYQQHPGSAWRFSVPRVAVLDQDGCSNMAASICMNNNLGVSNSMEAFITEISISERPANA